MYKLAIFDIDGTLTTKGNEIPKSTLLALKKLKKNNIECLIATGRERENLKDILKVTGVKNFIACNGHYVEYQGNVLYKYSFPKETIDMISKICKEKDYSYGLSNGQGRYIYNVEKLLKCGLENLLKNIKIIDKLEGEIESVVLFSEDNTHPFHPLKESHLLVPWGKGIYDVVKIDRSKAKGIKDIANHLGIEMAEIVSFGDSYNDLEMIQQTGLGIAMGNAKEELKEVADYVTDHVEDHGIYKALRKFEII